MDENITEIANQWRLLTKKLDNYIKDLAYKVINEVKGNNILEVDNDIIKNLVSKIEQETGIRVFPDKEDVKAINNYIRFRKIYPNFKQEELKKIIDGKLTLEDKLNLRSLKGMNNKEIIGAIHAIKQDWNKEFGLAYLEKTEDFQFDWSYDRVESLMKLDFQTIIFEYGTTAHNPAAKLLRTVYPER